MPVRTAPNHRSLLTSPQLAAAGAKINPKPGALGRAGRQRLPTPGRAESGFALKAVTCEWHEEKGFLYTVFFRDFFDETYDSLILTLSQAPSFDSGTGMPQDSPKKQS